MKLKYLFIILFLMIMCRLQAQHHHHTHTRNEVGLSTGAIYAIDDKAWGAGTHLHYFRTLGEHSRWALGGFVEQTWTHGTHFSLGIGAKYEVLERLQVGLFPGITFLKHQDDEHGHEKGNINRFSLHTEVVYDLFMIGKFHFGPVMDYSWSKNDSHTMLGIHGAYCF